MSHKRALLVVVSLLCATAAFAQDFPPIGPPPARRPLAPQEASALAAYATRACQEANASAGDASFRAMLCACVADDFVAHIDAATADALLAGRTSRGADSLFIGNNWACMRKMACVEGAGPSLVQACRTMGGR